MAVAHQGVEMVGFWSRRFSGIKLSVPFLGAEATWEPSRAEQDAAWELLARICTTVAVNDLGDAGTDREALDSLHTLFGATRDLLIAHGVETGRDHRSGNLSLATVAVRLLNTTLRPFLSTWHPRLLAHEAACPKGTDPGTWELSWGGHGAPYHQGFRQELVALQTEIRRYIFVLGRAAGTFEFAQAALLDSTPASRPQADLYARAALSHSTEIPARPKGRMVRWFDPVELAYTMRHAIHSGDDRDASTAPSPGPTWDYSDQHDLWFDYAADMGDAFDPTMQVAWTLGRRELEPAGSDEGALPRGRFLILGGDEVYPAASKSRYANQLTAPYQHALEPAGGEPPMVLAIPGNHDWYGGLGPWRALFCRTGTGPKQFCGWTVRQSTSWWSVKLPHGWWLWGLDTGLHGTINDRQRDYFSAMADQLKPGEQVILVTPVPLWRLRESKPAELDEMDAFVRSHIHDKGAEARVFFAGDFHIFACYTRRPQLTGVTEHHITSGGAGAFLHPTHNVAPIVPQTPTNDEVTRERAPFRGGPVWPDPHDSHGTVRNAAWVGVRDRQSVSLTILLGLLHALFTFGAAGGRGLARERCGGWSGLRRAAASVALHRPGSVWTVIFLLLLVGAGIGLAHPNTREPQVVRFARRAGSLHGLAQLMVFLATASLVPWAVGRHVATGRAGLAWGLVLAGLVGGFASVVVMVAYLSLVNRSYRVNDNEAFSLRHFGDGKHFLRCHLDHLGGLTVNLIGIERTQPGWAGAISGRLSLPPGSRAGERTRVGKMVWTTRIERELAPIEFPDGANRWIALSISDVDGASDADKARLDELFERLSIALLGVGCNLAYGGDLRLRGFTHKLVEISRRPAGYRSDRIRNYAARSILDKQTDADVDISGIEVIPVEGVRMHGATQEAADLTAMRERSTQETLARIVVGGRLGGSLGRAPGVLEEAAISAAHDQPLLILGGFGGAADAAARLVDPARRDVAGLRAQLVDDYPDIDPVLARLAAATPVGLHNGLTAAENEELFTSPEDHRLIDLVVKSIRGLAAGAS